MGCVYNVVKRLCVCSELLALCSGFKYIAVCVYETIIRLQDFPYSSSCLQAWDRFRSEGSLPFLGRESAEIDMTSIKLKTKEGRGRKLGKAGVRTMFIPGCGV